jgi:hypothetical protein
MPSGSGQGKIPFIQLNDNTFWEFYQSDSQWLTRDGLSWPVVVIFNYFSKKKVEHLICENILHILVRKFTFYSVFCEQGSDP